MHKIWHFLVAMTLIFQPFSFADGSQPTTTTAQTSGGVPVVAVPPGTSTASTTTATAPVANTLTQQLDPSPIQPTTTTLGTPGVGIMAQALVASATINQTQQAGTAVTTTEDFSTPSVTTSAPTQLAQNIGFELRNEEDAQVSNVTLTNMVFVTGTRQLRTWQNYTSVNGASSLLDEQVARNAWATTHPTLNPNQCVVERSSATQFRILMNSTTQQESYMSLRTAAGAEHIRISGDGTTVFTGFNSRVNGKHVNKIILTIGGRTYRRGLWSNPAMPQFNLTISEFSFNYDRENGVVNIIGNPGGQILLSIPLGDGQVLRSYFSS